MAPSLRSALVVDDNPTDIYLCERLLRRSGRVGAVHHVSSGEEALALFRDPEAAQDALPDAFPPEVLFLDINMPGMSGFEFLEQLEALDAEGALSVPLPTVLMLTSSASPADKKQAEQFSMVADFLTKPLKPDDVGRVADRMGPKEPQEQ